MPDSTDPRAAERFRQWMDEQDRAYAAEKARSFVPTPERSDDGGHNEKRDMPGMPGMDRDLGGQLAPDRSPTPKVTTPWLQDASSEPVIELDDEPEPEPLQPVWNAIGHAGERFRDSHPEAARHVGDAIWTAQQTGKEWDLKHQMHNLEHPEDQNFAERIVQQDDGPLQRSVEAARKYFMGSRTREPIQIDRSDDAEYVERVRQAMKNAGKK